MRIPRTIATAVAVLVLAAGVATTASAQQELKLNQVGAALAFPMLASSGMNTYITITNVGPSDRNLHFNAIGLRWSTTDFDCPVTASETVLVTVSAVDGFALISMECNQATGLPLSVSRLIELGGSEGVLFVSNETHECKDGSCTTNANDLFGDFVIVSAKGGFAWSAEAIPFQGINPLAAGVADRDYHFDNEEYAMFPATLATNFIAPGQNPVFGANVTAELLLFTLDGRANIQTEAAMDIVFFDDDETPTSAHLRLDCTALIGLEEIDPNFLFPFLGSGAGHLYMTVIDADQRSNVHDNKFGNGNAIRVVGVHGWLFQTAWANDAGVPGGLAWGRSLAQGMMPQDLDGSDRPTFDGL